MKTSHTIACISLTMILASVMIAFVSAFDDHGVVWVPQDSGIVADLNSVEWGGRQFVTVGDGGTIATSPDGERWSLQESGTTADLNDVAWNGQRFVAVGAGIILSSENGINWDFRSDAGGSSVRLDVVEWANGGFIARGAGRVAGDRVTMISGDGILWMSTDHPSGAASDADVAGSDIASNGLRAVAVGPKGSIVLADVSEVFSDDFETGDLQKWSSLWPPTPTPTSTPVQTPLCELAVSDLRLLDGSGNYSGWAGATITNSTEYTATITRVRWDWAANLGETAYNDWLRLCTNGATSPCASPGQEFWDDNTGLYGEDPPTGRYQRPLDVSGPPFVGQTSPPNSSQIAAGTTSHWWAYVRDTAPAVIWNGVYEVCLDFELDDSFRTTCSDLCASIDTTAASPTPASTPTPP